MRVEACVEIPAGKRLKAYMGFSISSGTNIFLGLLEASDLGLFL